MTPASDISLESLHAAATEIFTGAVKACNIASAFDRRLRFEGNTLHRLMPDGSGPAAIDLSAYKRIFVIALGKAAGPMLETLLERMKRRMGLRGICCSNQLPLNATGVSATLKAAIPCPTKTPSPPRAPRWPCCARRARIHSSSSSSPAAVRPCSICLSTRRSPWRRRSPFTSCCLPRARPSTRSTLCASIFPRSRAAVWPWPRRRRRRSACCFPMCRCARSTRSPPDPLRPTTPPWPTCASCLPNTIWRKNFRPRSARFSSARICPSRPGNKRLASVVPAQAALGR